MECGSDAHCKKGYMWGNKCMSTSSTSTYKYCRCKVNGDCAGNPNGPTCYVTYNKCSCKTNTDCKKAPYTKCLVPYSGATYKHCQKPCLSDKDCTSSTYKYCVKSTGKCVECRGKADCTGSYYKHCLAGSCVQCGTDKDCTSSTYKYCLKTTGSCVKCRTNKDCASSTTSPYCNTHTGSCQECASDAHCKSGYKWGNKCMSTSSTSTYKYCRCKANGDCAGNPNGPTCYATYNKCSCKTNADCKKAPYKTCKVPYSGATYKHCQK